MIDNLVIKNKKILLVKRRKDFLEGGKWSLVGGFMERNENIKEAACREILEETGYKVGKVVLFRIIDKPDRRAEDRQNISFVNFCVAKKKIQPADNESSEQAWFDLDNLPPKKEFAFDHFDNIKLYLKYLKNPFSLPKLG
ncbi:MAG: NUDIX hydrolase [Caldisericia bacterium]|nr:NUDIX hydrolase [Caldisericia bacterium]